MSFNCVLIQLDVLWTVTSLNGRSDFASAAVADGLTPEATFTNT